MRIASLIGVLGMVVACNQDAPTTATGNQALGIDRFAVDESSSKVVITGLDKDGAEVARLELVHGVFTLSEMFKDDYDTATVDGRKLTFDMGEHKMRWETAGYEPTMSLPSPRTQDWPIAEFLADPHVKPLLARWGIGFDIEPFSGDEAVYSKQSGSYRGGNAQACINATSCGTAYNGTVNTCGGGAAAFYAGRVDQVAGTNCGYYTSSYNQALLSQCCPAGSGGQSTNWFAQKACPTTTNNNTVCGVRTTGACKACPTYPTASYYCDAGVLPTTVGTCGAATIKTVSYTNYNTVCDYCYDHGADCCEGTCTYSQCP